MGRPIRINRKLVFAETTRTSKGQCLDSKPDLLNYSTFAAMVPTSRGRRQYTWHLVLLSRDALRVPSLMMLRVWWHQRISGIRTELFNKYSQYTLVYYVYLSLFIILIFEVRIWILNEIKSVISYYFVYKQPIQVLNVRIKN